MRLRFAADKLRILCLGAHSDDIEIGCGGTVLKLIESYPDLAVRWLVFSANSTRRAEAMASAGLFLGEVREKQVEVMDYRDGFFPYVGGEIKEAFERLKADYAPNIVFTHYRNDRHQDHRVISDLAWNTFRSHLILEYEIPKYDGDLGNPEFYVPLDEPVVDRKIGRLLAGFQSQAGKQWFSDDTFRALLRLRGIEANGSTPYAEAFYARKLLLS